MRHINIREKAVPESQNNGEISVNHIEGKLNPSDLLTFSPKNTKQVRSIFNFATWSFHPDQMGGVGIPHPDS